MGKGNRRYPKENIKEKDVDGQRLMKFTICQELHQTFYTQYLTSSFHEVGVLFTILWISKLRFKE